MNQIRLRDLAVVVQGLWPNVGRLVYVSGFVQNFDFSAMGLGIRDGWRVRSWSSGPLETTEGPRMVGITPVGSLRRLDRLPPEQQKAVELEMAHADFEDALCELVKYFEEQESLVAV